MLIPYFEFLHPQTTEGARRHREDRDLLLAMGYRDRDLETVYDPDVPGWVCVPTSAVRRPSALARWCKAVVSACGRHGTR